MPRTDNPREAVLWALRELTDYNLKILKFHLWDETLLNGPGLARGDLEGLNQVDLASRLILMYGAHEAVKVMIKVLKVMNMLDLVDKLSTICLNDYRETYREHVRCLEEMQEEGVNHRYNQLLLVAKPSPGSPTLEQELTVEALFDPRERSDQGPPTVVIQGFAGTGKTTLARKMVLDWATGTLYPGQFDYVFHVSCREVVLLPGSTLDQLLIWCCGDSKAPVAEIRRQQPERLLFILDGYDELQRCYAERLRRPAPTPIEDMLHRLLRREVLPTSSLLITTRPLALRNLESLLTHPRHVHVLGFSNAEKEKYFRSYFRDEEQTRNAFDFVQRNGVLYKACQVPGICWVVCSWLKGQMERGGVVTETPSNSTDIFMAYVSTFLPPSDNEGCSNLTRHKILKGLCSLAAEGIQHQRFLFEEAELRQHNLDGPSLAPFLSSVNYQEGLTIKKFYSFRHISFQEFFHAVSYLVKEDQAQLGGESLKEVTRLLEEKKPEAGEEMTLSMQFLLDISQKESSLNFELKFCFKISPLIRQDLKNFKELMTSIKHKRTWDFEFSLCESKIKNLVKGVSMNDVTMKVKHSSEKKSNSSNSFSVKTSLSNKQKGEQKCLTGDKGNRAGTQMEALREKAEGQGTRDKDGRSSRMGSTEMRTLELKESGGGEAQESEGKTELKGMERCQIKLMGTRRSGRTEEQTEK